MNNCGERLKYVREKLLKMTRSEVHNKYGLSIDTLSAWENLRVNITEKGVERCIKIFTSENLIISKKWLITGEGLGPKFFYDIQSYLSDDTATDINEKVDDNLLLIKEIEFFKSLSVNSVVCLISNDDMLPLYARGDYVGGRFRFGDDIASCVSKDCIVKTNDSGMYVRRVVKNVNKNSYNLTCLNPVSGGTQEPVFFNVQIEAAAPIIWHRRLQEEI